MVSSRARRRDPARARTNVTRSGKCRSTSAAVRAHTVASRARIIDGENPGCTSLR